MSNKIILIITFLISYNIFAMSAKNAKELSIKNQPKDNEIMVDDMKKIDNLITESAMNGLFKIEYITNVSNEDTIKKICKKLKDEGYSCEYDLTDNFNIKKKHKIFINWEK